MELSVFVSDEPLFKPVKGIFVEFIHASFIKFPAFICSDDRF